MAIKNPTRSWGARPAYSDPRSAGAARPFFTERSLAAYLSVSERTIRNWIRCGDLPSYKLGAARRIDPVDVRDFLTRHRDDCA